MMKRKAETLGVIIFILFVSFGSAFSYETSLNGGEYGLSLIQSFAAETIPGTTDDELETLQTLSTCYVLDSIETVEECENNYGEDMPANLGTVLPDFEDSSDSEVSTPSELGLPSPEEWSNVDSNECGSSEDSVYVSQDNNWYYCMDNSNEADDWYRTCDNGVNLESDGYCDDSEAEVVDYLDFNNSGTYTITERVGDENDLRISLNISTNDVEDFDATPTVNLMEDGEDVVSREVDVDDEELETISATWEEIGGESYSWEETDTGSNSYEFEELSVEMEGNEEGEAWWDRQVRSLNSTEIVRCGDGHDYTPFYENNAVAPPNDECVDYNREVRRQSVSIAAESGWNLHLDTDSIDTLEELNNETNNGMRTLEIDTGDSGVCGDVYFSNIYDEDGEAGVGSTIQINAAMSGGEDRQPFFIERNGETVNETVLDRGVSETSYVDVVSGQEIKVGIRGGTDSCNQYVKRTDLSVEVPEENFGLP